jgi:hypothetical protein
MKFNIRDLLWLTLLAAVAVAWWMDHQSEVQRIEFLKEKSSYHAYPTSNAYQRK